MGIFNSLFRNRSEADKLNSIGWIKLESVTDIDQIIDQSKINTIVIFKHSSRCGISSIVLRKFEKQTILVSDQTNFHLLNVIQHRNISNEICKLFSVHHESPQLLIIKKGKVIAHASHYAILNIDLSKYERT